MSDEFELSVDIGIEFNFLSQALSIMSPTGVPEDNGFLSFSNPVAITVTKISSSKLSSITAPKIIFASGSTLRWINSAAVFTSCNPRLVPPVILIITPLAPSIDVSSNGLWIACFAASSALFSPDALPI